MVPVRVVHVEEDRSVAAPGRWQGGGVRCPGCGLESEEDGLAEAPGGPASVGCHARFGVLLARSYDGYARDGLRSVHQLVVDAYVTQHPGGTGRTQVQAVALCLMTLQLVLEDGVDPVRGSELHAVMADHPAGFRYLEPPAVPAALTVADVLAGPGHDHDDLVRAWSAAVWASWSAHHATVRGWNRECLTGRVRLP